MMSESRILWNEGYCRLNTIFVAYSIVLFKTTATASSISPYLSPGGNGWAESRIERNGWVSEKVEVAQTRLKAVSVGFANVERQATERRN